MLCITINCKGTFIDLFVVPQDYSVTVLISLNFRTPMATIFFDLLTLVVSLVAVLSG